MKLSVLFFFVSFMTLQANDTYSQQTKITLELNNVTVSELLDEIEASTQFRFIYKLKDINLNRKVSVNVNKQEITTILESVFKTTTTDYNVIKKRVYLIEKKDKPAVNINNLNTSVLKPQKITIKGIVTDENGVPLPGANILEKGTSNGTQTDFDGNYTLNVENTNAILVVSYLGYVTKEIPVNNKSTINVVMIEDSAKLDEVVVVGYGKQKRATITGSVATVQSKDLVQTPTTNTTQSLAGRLPGLVVTQNDGQPGGDQANVRIRGFGNALVIVDGVPRDYQQLDPNEIESISVLKDASAAVYGARAGNGVILVTTKRGKIGRPKINFSSSITFQQPTFLPEIADAASYADYVQRAERLEGVAEADLTYSNEDIVRFKAGTEEGFKGTDWQDVVLKDWSMMHQHNVNVRGGTEKVKYFGSVGALQQNSLLESGDGKFERYNIGLTLDADISDRLTVGLNLKYREQETETPVNVDNGEDAYRRIFRFIASSNPAIQRNPDGLLTASHPLGQSAVAYSNSSITGFFLDKRKQFDLIANFDYDIPVSGLSAFGKLAFQRSSNLSRKIRTPFTTYDHDFVTGESTESFTTNIADTRVSNDDFSRITTQVGLDFSRTFGVHNLSAKAIYENIYTDTYNFYALRNNPLTIDQPFLFAAIGEQQVGDNFSQNGRSAFIGRVNYDYKEKFLLEALYRLDANIQFPTETRWGLFPGISLGWVMSKEDFLSDSSTVDFLKIRASVASLGFDNISNFDYLSGYSLRNAINQQYLYEGQEFLTTLRTEGLANPNITWEEMTTYNLGLDATFWNSALGIEFDAFYRKRTGLLATRQDALPDTFGAVLPRENLEERDNRGFELVLTHKNTIGDLNINISGNVTWTREKFVKVIEREFDLDDPDDARLNQRTGQWVNRRFGYRTDGFYDTQEEIDNDGLEYPQLGEPKLGDVKYVDRNGDNIIDFRDQEVIGRNQTPEWFFGLNVNLEYKGFDFAMLWQGATNFDVVPNDLELAATTSIGFVPFQYQVDHSWNPDNPSAAKLPAPSTIGLNQHNDATLDIYQRDATYARLKSLTLGYSIPQSFLNKINVKNARIYLAGYNLLTLQKKNIFNIDPEARSQDGIATYPVQRNVSLGINVGL
ncbi:SusC/RagA family TonB-linked outer membrane protein [Seonamhaeicola algicola]|nr:TonB-dependent receptor [Seonamhaeicola algicola]